MLAVERLEKRFVSHARAGRELVGFAPLSFQVPAGSALGLTGPSGTGKSSVLKCIFRTYGATAGRILYRSAALGPVDLARLPEKEVLRLRRSEVGYVTQFLSVAPRVPALEIVAEPLLLAGVPRQESLDSAQRLLSRLGIAQGLHDLFPATFSGGEKQRVNLARAVIRPPRLLLLDEPTASLDPGALAVALEILKELKRQGTTMIAVFHDRSLMDALVDAAFCMPQKETPP
jgi:alpha-D-ribose 1-methylphosphonate 5-triphosphate synthase subunit PhnL